MDILCFQNLNKRNMSSEEYEYVEVEEEEDEEDVSDSSDEQPKQSNSNSSSSKSSSSKSSKSNSSKTKSSSSKSSKSESSKAKSSKTNSKKSSKKNVLQSDDDYSSSDDEYEIEKIIGINSNNFTNLSKLKYYIKPKDDSYIHCRWITYSELIKNPKGQTILPTFERRYRNTAFRKCNVVKDLYLPEFQKFDSKWLQPESIIGILPKQSKNDQDQYFIKWKNQPYSESTWEFEKTVKCSDLVRKYRQRLKRGIQYKKQITPKFEEVEFKPYSKSPPYKNGHTLSDYQVNGLNWLRQNYRLKRNNILADEMGLGKTIQALSLLMDLYKNCNIPGPFLVITPLSTIENWMREIKEWTDFETVAFYGPHEDREILTKHCIFHPTDKSKVIFNILVVPFNIVTLVLSTLQKIYFHYLIVDEAHRLKNFDSKAYKEISSLHFDHCTFLTGTPVQNDMSELWALLHFLDKKTFPTFAEFQKKFGETVTAGHIEDIQKAIQPYILRRKKADVNIEIGQKEEIIVEVELTRFQRDMYRSILQENKSALIHENPSISLTNIAMQLRKICNHPYTIKTMEDIGNKQYKIRHSIPLDAELSEPQIAGSIVEASGKMIFLDKLLPTLEGHRILIFSQMTSILDIIEDYCYYKKYNYERIDGSVIGTERQERIDRFMHDKDSFIFLLSTKAGGLGINLTIADTVIIYDSDWNPQNDIQAQSRCHRIGQTMDVNVYRLVTRGTYEDEMFKRASKKLGLDTAILDAKVSEFTEEEMEAILQKGALFLLDDNDNEIDKFENEDITQILERRSKKPLAIMGNSMFSRVVISKSLEFQGESEDGIETTDDNEKSNKGNLTDNSVDSNSTDAENSNTNESDDLGGRNIWQELFPDIDEDDIDRERKQRKQKDEIWTKEAAIDTVDKCIKFGWVGLINDDANPLTKVYTKTLAWCAYTTFGRKQKHKYLMNRLIGLSPNEEIASYLAAYPFSDTKWIISNRNLFESFLDALNEMLNITRCITFLSVNDLTFIIPLRIQKTPPKPQQTDQKDENANTNEKDNTNENNNSNENNDTNKNDNSNENNSNNDGDNIICNDDELPMWWSPIDDYSLLLGFYRYGFEDYESMLTNKYMSFKWRVDVCGNAIAPSSTAILRRKNGIISFLKERFSEDFLEDLGELCSLQRWMHRQQKFIREIPIDGTYIKRIYIALQHYGIEYNTNTMQIDFAKLQDHSNLEFMNSEFFALHASLVFKTLISARPILGLKLSRQLYDLSKSNLDIQVKNRMAGKMHFVDLSTIDKSLIEETADMVILFIKLRALLPQFDSLSENKLNMTKEQVWKEAPSWWIHGVDDIKLAKVIAKRGIGSVVEVAIDHDSPFHKRIHPVNPQALILTEKMMMNQFCSMVQIDENRCLSNDILKERLAFYAQFLEYLVGNAN